MSPDAQSSVAAPGVKIATAWLAALGISSWSDLAAALAALYTLILILEWLWKKFGRRFAEARGWMKRQTRRFNDDKDGI